MSWTTERVELLTKLWAEGLSASQIASELGNVTRNAVIGKVHRLGLSGRTKTSGAAAKPRRATSAPAAEPAPAKVAAAVADSAPVAETQMNATAKTATQTTQRTTQTVVSGANALKITPEEDDIVGDLTPVAAPEVAVPVSQRASILTLTERTCKWPIGDPNDEDFYFCGRSCDAASPYCEYHRTIAYQPVNDRRKERKSA